MKIIYRSNKKSILSFEKKKNHGNLFSSYKDFISTFIGFFKKSKQKCEYFENQGLPADKDKPGMVSEASSFMISSALRITVTNE